MKLGTGNNKEVYTIPQGLGYVDVVLDTDYLYPVLFKCNEGASGNVAVVTWDGSEKTLAGTELSSDHMLIKQIKTTGTTMATSDMRLLR